MQTGNLNNTYPPANRYILLLFLSCLIADKPAQAQYNPEVKFRTLVSNFIDEYKKLNIKELDLDYKKNLAEIAAPDSLDTRIKFFKLYQHEALRIEESTISKEQQGQLGLLKYQINYDLRRAELEKKFLSEKKSENETGAGLSGLKDGKAWYKLYIDKYTSRKITPEQLMILGKKEVDVANRRINHIKNELGYKNQDNDFYRHLKDSAFFLTTETVINARYDQIQNTVFANLSREFADTHVPEAVIKPSPQPSEQTPPAYFDNGVFYYNFYQNKLNRRNMDFLYLHEGVPGHHYDAALFNKRQQYPLEKLFVYSYNGSFEGWAAYVESLGKTLGLYQDPYAELGRWQWDLVRSARIVMDVGIHYYGWTKEGALKYWQNSVPGQEEISVREVNRCYNWPAQVLSYKVGAETITDLKKYAKRTLGRQYNEQQFHTIILERLKLPLQVLEEEVKREINARLSSDHKTTRLGVVDPVDR